MSSSYLDPVVLAGIASLRLRARRVAEGFIAGLHHSAARGHSLEFAQHREYATGDELRHIDWKVYARSDRFFVKQFEEESNLRLTLLLDASGSMGFRGEKSALSKYDYAATLAASLAYLALRQGDSVGLGYSRGGKLKLVPPRNSLSHLNALLDELEGLRPEGPTRVAQDLEALAHSFKKRSLVILISDLLDDMEQVRRSLKFLGFKKNEAVVLHLLDRDEREFPYRGEVRFDSLEDGRRIALDADAFREDYRAALNGWVEECRLALRNAGVDYAFHGTDEPMEKVLQSVLRH